MDSTSSKMQMPSDALKQRMTSAWKTLGQCPHSVVKMVTALESGCRTAGTQEQYAVALVILSLLAGVSGLIFDLG